MLFLKINIIFNVPIKVAIKNKKYINLKKLINPPSPYKL